ncbi:putative lambda gpD-like head decoration protein [Halorubrum tailed virus 27]|uniref:Lambda gpD-like head decoration protein n=1 Tax=Halorubrum tailed virus 27 TaxID=2878008 RepID=A0AAE9BYB2_9CAUD|nr:putative lambda gpD-like head decoration protein [Halorubrum tailed virus 27]UBF22704.1 putative lambda gpD-like head decoration protein [Halorubrum tailed virus 27]
MADIKIATGAEQPINRHSAVAAEEFEQGDLVGFNGSGEFVKADASNGIAAVGMAMAPVRDLANYSAGPEKLAVEENYALVGRDRVTAIRFGIEAEDNDAELGVTGGDRVYLGDAGAVTTTAPSTAGDIVQVVGVGIAPERFSLDVSADHSVSA